MVETFVTPNHKLYVKSRSGLRFELVEAKKVYGKRYNFKRNCNNTFKNNENIILKDSQGFDCFYNMEFFLKFLGMFISDGCVCSTSITIGITKQRKKDYLDDIANKLGLVWTKSKPLDDGNQKFTMGKNKCPGIFELFKELSVGALNKYLPDLVWTLGQEDCRHLLDGLLNGDGSTRHGTAVIMYYTSSPRLANDVQRLTLHCGWSSNISIVREKGHETSIIGRNGLPHIIKSNADALRIGINRNKNEPQINHGHVKQQNGQSEEWVDFKGQVGCLEIPETHLFYYRENQFAPPHWTGNSSRQG
jgi:hypothetical protein